MNPTNDDAAPRRDGWFEHRGTWGEVTVGTVLASEKRSERWEVIAVSHGQQVQYGWTLWFRVREQTSGVEHTIQPKLKTASVTILTQDPADTETAPPTPPSDAEAIQLLITELGAELLASRDNETGEITCPDYVYTSHIPGVGDRQMSRGLVEHLKFAHGVTDIQSEDIGDLTTFHARCHDPKWQVGKGGFPHRHVPEDLSQF